MSEDEVEVTVRPTTYMAWPTALADDPDRDLWSVTVEWRGSADGGRWAVMRRGSCLTADGSWEYEPNPSSRDDAFKARARFDLDTALRLAREAVPGLTVNGWTLPVWQEHWRKREAVTDRG